MALGSERPFGRSIIKLAATAFLGRTRAHAHNAWPGLRLRLPEGGGGGGIMYRGLEIASLLPFSVMAAASGADIHVIGSGPSVMDNDLSAIGAGTAILLNGSIILIGDEISQPLAVAIEDERFVWRHFQLMRQKIAPECFCLFSVGVMRAICEIEPRWLDDKKIILIDDIRKPYAGRRRSAEELARYPFVLMSEDGTAGFSKEPWQGVFQGGSVVISALQFAVACGPERIGLFGIDISNADAPRFYEKSGQTAKSGVAGAKQRILTQVSLAKAAGEERGITLLNFSKVSALAELGLAYDRRFARPVDG